MKKRKIGRPRMYQRPPKILVVPLPAPIHQAVKREAAARGISASRLVRHMLAKGLCSLRPPTSSGGYQPCARQLIK